MTPGLDMDRFRVGETVRIFGLRDTRLNGKTAIILEPKRLRTTVHNTELLAYLIGVDGRTLCAPEAILWRLHDGWDTTTWDACYWRPAHLKDR